MHLASRLAPYSRNASRSAREYLPARVTVDTEPGKQFAEYKIHDVHLAARTVEPIALARW